MTQETQAQAVEPTAAEAMAAGCVGCQLSFTWLGESRTIDEAHTAEAAAIWQADAESCKAVKRILNPSRPELRALNLKRNEARRYWLSVTLPYLRGLRLLPLSSVEAVEAKLAEYGDEVRTLAAGLTSIHFELVDEARRRLGRLFNPADYPASLADAFRLRYSFPSVTPPDYLATLAPEVYRRESERVRLQFSAAAEAAEAALSAEFAAMVERITATLRATDESGKPRIFRDSLIGNLGDFFERFRSLRVGSGRELAEVIDRAQALARNVTPQALRDSADLRGRFADSFADIERQLTAAIAPAGRRLRTSATAEPIAEAQAEPQPAAEPEAEPVAIEPEPQAAEPPPVIRRRLVAPVAVQPEPVAQAQAEPVAIEPEPEPVAQAEPVAIEPEPEPVAQAQAEPQAAAEPAPLVRRVRRYLATV